MTNWHARIDGLLNPARDLEALAHEMADENARLRAAVAEAIATIKVWHGPVGWDIYYYKSPEMIRIRAALAGEDG